MGETHSIYGAECPCCGHLNRASDSDGLLFEECRDEWECEACDEVFIVSAHCQWSWTARKKDEATP